MKEIKFVKELENVIAETEIIKAHEKKAKREIRKQRINDLIVQGIDKEIAKVMVDVEMNPIYGF